jgi:hypothetical protein
MGKLCLNECCLNPSNGMAVLVGDGNLLAGTNGALLEAFI